MFIDNIAKNIESHFGILHRFVEQTLAYIIELRTAWIAKTNHALIYGLYMM